MPYDNWRTSWAVKVVSWNINKKTEPWRQLLPIDPDIALVQEAVPPIEDVVRLRDATLPPPESTRIVEITRKRPWDSHGWNADWWHGRGPELYDRWPMVVKLSRPGRR